MMQDELDDWFMILLGPWGREDQPETDPEIVGIPSEFLRRLRDLAPEWGELGIDPDDTVGCYEDERLRVGFEIGDDQQQVQLAVLRVEFSNHNWQAAWANATEGITAPTMAEAHPRGHVVGGSISSDDGSPEIVEALDWVREQLGRPIERLDWAVGDGTSADQSSAEQTSRMWRFADTSEAFVASGNPGDPADASASRVRP